MQLQTLQDLYVDVLKDLYDAESQILKALPKMAKAANSTELQQGFREHLDQTQRHVERLEQVFDHLGKPAKRKKCKAIEGLLEEGKELMEEANGSEALDAGLIAAAQKVEHYEIASYGCARAYAELLQESEASKLLQQTLDEEKLTDRKLTELAMNQINRDAANGAMDDEDDDGTNGRPSSSRRRPAARASRK